MAANPLLITDTTLRDAHQSVLATRLRTSDMETIAADLDSIGYHSVEVWGGATFDTATRYLGEDPWERLRTLKHLMPRTPLSMLLRGQSLVGYRNYADDLVRTFVQHSADGGIDVFRVFDALNDERNLRTAADAVKKSGKHLQLAMCYSVTEEGRMGGAIYTLDYYLEKARLFRSMGADSICIKDMAGLLAPYDAHAIVSALKEELDVPLQLHTHYTSGMASMTVLKSVEAGVDVVDACLSPLALRTSQPAVEPIVVSLRGSERDSGLDLDRIIALGERLEEILPKYKEYLSSPRASVIDARVLSHQIPGGMLSNLVNQLKEADALARVNEVLEEVPRTRKELGYPPLVTPTSQIIGTQAVNNVLFGRYKMVTDQVKDYVYGLYGRPPGEMDKEVAAKILAGYENGDEPITARPADLLEPEVEEARASVKDLSTDLDDVLTYALYPTTGLRFLRIKHGLESQLDDMRPAAPAPPPTQAPQQAGAGPRIMARSPAPPKSSQARAFNVYLDDQFYRVEVDVAEAARGAPARPAAQPGPAPQAPEPGPSHPQVTLQPGEVTVKAPMPGLMLRYLVEEGQQVDAGTGVVVLEAMKMENSLPAPVSGTISSLPLQPGAIVERDEVLVVLVPT